LWKRFQAELSVSTGVLLPAWSQLLHDIECIAFAQFLGGWGLQAQSAGQLWTVPGAAYTQTLVAFLKHTQHSDA
jgi:hypothetical protein